MSARIVVFGATGYTGTLTVKALLEQGATPVLAARSQAKLDALNAELGTSLETVVADISNPASIEAALQPGDVLLTTVGPFRRWGEAAITAAVAAKANYIDSTGEPAFVRDLFERHGKAAADAGVALLPAMGYDYVPGNLAGGLALREAGPQARAVDIGYFMTGGATSAGDMSGGTKASLVGAAADQSYAWRNGSLQTERAARSVKAFNVNGKQLSGVSIGCSEHLSLSRVYPQLLNINVYLGWFGPYSRVVQGASAVGALGMKIPGVQGLMRKATSRVKGSTGGPDEQERAKSGSHSVAVALDASGNPLAEVHLAGVNGYTFTGKMLAWAAIQAAEGKLKATGAVGPVEAFGLDELQAGASVAGLDVV